MDARLTISPAELVQIIESICLYNGHHAKEIVVLDEDRKPITVPTIEVITEGKPLVVRISEEDESGMNGMLAKVRRHYGSSNGDDGGGSGREGGEGGGGPSAAVGPVAS